MKRVNYTQVDKVIEFKISLKSSAVLGELIYKQNYWIEKGGIKPHTFKNICVDGTRTKKSIKCDSFFFSFSDIRKEKPSMNLDSISNDVKELELAGLIYYQKGYLGHGSKFHVRMDEYEAYIDYWTPIMRDMQVFFDTKDRHDAKIDFASGEKHGYYTWKTLCNKQEKPCATNNLTNNSIIYSVTQEKPCVAESTVDKGIDNKSTPLHTDQTLEANGLNEDAVQEEKPSVALPVTKKAEDIFKECIEGYDFTNEGWDKLYDNLKETKYVSDAEPKDRGYMKKVMDKLHKDGKLIERLTGNSNGSKQPLMNIMMDMSTTPW